MKTKLNHSILISECHPSISHFVKIVYPVEAFVDTDLHEKMPNILTQNEIKINQTIADEEVDSNVFLEKIFNHIWVLEKDDKQSKLKRKD